MCRRNKSAYIEKGGKGQELNMENNSSQLTSETFLDSDSTKYIVANESDHVKQKRFVEEYSLNVIEEDV